MSWLVKMQLVCAKLTDVAEGTASATVLGSLVSHSSLSRTAQPAVIARSYLTNRSCGVLSNLPFQFLISSPGLALAPLCTE